MKVVVYFTDGYVNTIQDHLSCSGTPTLYNYGGHDTGSSVDVFDPVSGNSVASYDGSSKWTPSHHVFEECDASSRPPSTGS